MVELQKKRPFKSILAELPLKFILIIALFILALILFSFITHEVVFEKKDTIDKEIVQFISSHTTESSIRVMRFFTVFGSSIFLFPVYSLMVAYFLVSRKTMLGLHIGLIAISGTALSFGVKRLFQRPRPDLPLIESLKTYSYPSGHALSSIIFCSILVYLLWRSGINSAGKWMFSILLFVFAMTIGISRIVLNVHYPTDVIAGFCLGFIWVSLSFYLLSLIKRKPS
jgi:undecaprenyl-diphosphatase